MERPDAIPVTLRPLSLSLQVNGNADEDENNELLSLSTGVLKFPDDPSETEYTFGALDLTDLGAIGSGNFGTVYKMLHKGTGREMAVKRIRFHNINGREQERLLREHNTIVKSEKCPNIVKFYGVIFHEGDCWICMELMDASLDRLYRRVYNHLSLRLEENVIGHIAVSTIQALDYLKTDLKIMHRDVKPSNILVNGDGHVKLCDFGICGELEDSVAKTHDIGCQPYLAPERITKMNKKGYDVRSDIWSLGITLYEISMGEFPYVNWCSPFEQINAVVHGDPPMLTLQGKYEFSHELVKFVNSCLTKDYHSRPKYDSLMKATFFQRYAEGGPLIADAKSKLGYFASDTRNNPEIAKA